MKKLSALLIAVCAAAFLAACGGQDKPDGGVSVKKITAEEAKAMMDEGGVTVVDVRRQEEYDAGHVPGAVLVPNETIGGEAPAELPDKSAALLVYCRSGRRSAQAAEKLSKLGYTEIYDFGGIIDWPYETEQSPKS